VNLDRKLVKLKRAFGIRARFGLLAVILVVPLMLERIHSLEKMRIEQIARTTAEFTTLARNSADAQRAVISSVETILKSEAFVQASAGALGRGCDVLHTGLPANLPWIRSLSLAGQDGRIRCSTNDTDVGLDLSDRPYFREARETGRFVLGDFVPSGPSQVPTVMAAYPVSAPGGSSTALVATVNLDWMSKLMKNLGGRPGVSTVLIDSAGNVLAAPPGEVWRPLADMQLMSAIDDMSVYSNHDEGSLSFTAPDGSKLAVSVIRIAGGPLRLISNINEAAVSTVVSRDIRTTYLQLGFFCLLVLLGTQFAAQELVITPIKMLAETARRFGEGDLSARAVRNRLPADLLPVARAFNAMASQLARHARKLIANNDQLRVMASIDMLSGLANRRSFQSRLDFEWTRALQYDGELSLLMIDVDHFKLYNDTYGHLEGDACLTKIGEALSGVVARTMGFAARYGGEEFCLLLPNTDLARATEIGREVRSAVLRLSLPHAASDHKTVTVSIGIATVRPDGSLRPNELIEAADAALYAAKLRGRNTVTEHGLPLPTNEGVARIAMTG